MSDLFDELVWPVDCEWRPSSVETIATAYRLLKEHAPPPDAWVIVIPDHVRRTLWNMQKPMRKKIVRMEREMQRR